MYFVAGGRDFASGQILDDIFEWNSDAEVWNGGVLKMSVPRYAHGVTVVNLTDICEKEGFSYK